jgi:exodeoxyribonuclease III
MKIVSWNVNGIRATVGREFYPNFDELNADIFCIQETKAQDDQVIEALADMTGYSIVCTSAEKKGYSGVAIISKETPLKTIYGIGVAEHDTEGRVVTNEYADFYLVNVYVPNSGEGMKRLEYRSEWDQAFAKFLKKLRAKKSVIVCGDFNVAHGPIDLARPKENYNKTSGYTQTEIDGMSLLMKQGFVDSFRTLHPEKVQYSFWSVRFGARAKNLGWRIDYFLVDEKIKNKISNAEIHDQLMGSDHCPISVTLDL